MEQNGVWSESFKVLAFMTGEDRRITVPHIANLLQEVAGNHALDHQLGFEHMKAHAQFWVLNRLRIQIKERASWRSQLTIQTWVSSMKGPFSHRNFKMLNENGDILGAACALWVLLDATTRRPVRIAEHSLPILEDQEPLCGYPPKISASMNSETLMKLQVRQSDLDMIGHVNNVRYIQWMLDALRPNQQGSDPCVMDINFIGESFLNEQLHISLSSQDDQQQIAVISEKDNKEICRALYY